MAKTSKEVPFSFQGTKRENALDVSKKSSTMWDRAEKKNSSCLKVIQEK